MLLLFYYQKRSANKANNYMKTTINTAIVLTLFTISIVFNQQVFAQSKLPINEKVTLNGYYNTYDTNYIYKYDKNDTNTTVDILVFLNATNIFYNGHAVSSERPDFNWEFFKRNAKRRIGSYSILDDSLYVSVNTAFAGPSNMIRYFRANYSGYILNKDTIIGWKMIPPYPKVKLRFNEHFYEDTIPKTLFFVPHKKVEQLQQYIKQ